MAKKQVKITYKENTPATPKSAASAESTADWVKRHKAPNDDAIERVGRSPRRAASGRVDPEKQAAEDAAAQAAKGTEREKDRRPGETDEQYEVRMEKIKRRGMTGAELMAYDAALTQIALDEKRKRPIFGEISVVNANGRIVAITYSKKHYDTPGDGSVQLNAGHIYRIRTDDGAADLTRQVPNRPPVPLKRVAFDTVHVGMCGELVYVGGHVMGYKAPESWIFVLDDALTSADVNGTTKTQPNATALTSSKGVVEGVRGMPDGTVTVAIRLDGHTVVAISMLPDAAPSIGTRGTITYVGADATFAADEPHE